MDGLQSGERAQPRVQHLEDFQDGKSAALSKDALESTHPIYNPVETPAAAAELFDNITYEKGCAVMRMLENFLGEEDFRAGLRTYMKEFEESNATRPTSGGISQQASNAPVTRIMESWINQGGYPVVSVSLDGDNIRVSQKRFFSSPGKTAGADQLWQVPLMIRYEDAGGAHQTRALLSERETTLPIQISGDLKWLYANEDEVGFYRQNLQGDLLNKALRNLDKLSPLEQMGLLGDQWGLVRNGATTITQFLDVLSAMLSTRNYSVLGRVSVYLYGIDDMLEKAGDDAALQNFREWVDRSFKSQLDELGYEPRPGEDQNDSQRRAILLSILGNVARDQSVIAKATAYADKEAADPASVDPNLAGVFVSTASRFGDRERMDRNVEIYDKRRASGASPQETMRYLNSLPDFEAPELVDNVFRLIDTKVVPQEAVGPFLRTMLAQRHSQVRAWEYTKENWTKLLNSLGEMWPGFLIEAAGYLPASYRSDLVNFYEQTGNGTADKAYARGLETMDQTAEFESRTKQALVNWFKNK